MFRGFNSCEITDKVASINIRQFRRMGTGKSEEFIILKIGWHIFVYICWLLENPNASHRRKYKNAKTKCFLSKSSEQRVFVFAELLFCNRKKNRREKKNCEKMMFASLEMKLKRETTLHTSIKTTQTRQTGEKNGRKMLQFNQVALETLFVKCCH